MTKQSYEELERQLAELKRGLRNNNTDFELAFLDHYLDHFNTLTRRAETAETELLRVRGLLQRGTELLKKSLPTLRWAVDMELDGARVDDLNHLVEVGRLLGEIDRLPDPTNFPQSSSLMAQGAESADIGKLDAADKSRVEMGKVNRVDEIDEQFKGMATDEQYQAETLKIEKEFAQSDWEALLTSEDWIQFRRDPDNGAGLHAVFIDGTPIHHFKAHQRPAPYIQRVRDAIKRVVGRLAGSAETGGEKAAPYLLQQVTMPLYVFVAVKEFLMDWRKGDFQLTKLASLDAEAIESAIERWASDPNFPRSSQNQTVSGGVEGAHEGTTADKSGVASPEPLPTQLPKEE